MLRRFVLRQVGRTGAGNHFQHAQGLAQQPVVAGFTDPNDAIDTFLGEINMPVIAANVQLKRRMPVKNAGSAGAITRAAIRLGTSSANRPDTAS